MHKLEILVESQDTKTLKNTLVSVTTMYFTDKPYLEEHSINFKSVTTYFKLNRKFIAVDGLFSMKDIQEAIDKAFEKDSTITPISDKLYNSIQEDSGFLMTFRKEPYKPE